MSKLILEDGSGFLLLEDGSFLLLDEITSSLSWTTASNLGIVFENDNLLIPLVAVGAVNYDMVITSRGALTDPIENIGTKTIVINEKNIRLGFRSGSQLDGKRFFNDTLIDTGLIPGSTFTLTDFLGTDTFTNEVIVTAGTMTFPVTGTMTIGTSTTNTIVTFSAAADLPAVISAINAITNNATYGIEATTSATSTLELVKNNVSGGNDILTNTDNITAGDLALTDGVFFIGLDNVVTNINRSAINTDNIVASVQGSGPFSLRIADSITSVSLTDIDSNIDELLKLPRFSPVARDEVAMEINDVEIDTNVTATILGSDRLELVGPKIFLDTGGGDSADVLEILKIDQAGNEFIQSPITEWLFLDGSTGVLQGTTPDVLITTLISFVARATAVDDSTLDQTFQFIIQPIEAESQISWNPGSIGTFNEGDVSEANVPVVNFDTIKSAASFFVLRPTTFNFLDRDISPWRFTRDSIGSYIDRQGVLRFVDFDEERFDYDGGNLGSLQGLLVEPAITNQFTRSNQFDTTWVQTNIFSVNENAGIAPTNINESWKLVSGTTSGIHGLAQSISLTSTTEYTVSVFAKASEDNLLWSRIGTGGTDSWIVFNLTTGVVSNTNNGTTTSAINGNVIVLNNSWYRCEVTFTASTTAGTNIGFFITQNSTTPTTVFVGNDVDGLLLYGSQFETSGITTSYYPTASSVATRAADLPVLDLFNLDYNVTVTGPGGSTATPVTVTNKEFTLQARTGERHVQSVIVDRYHQNFVLDGTNLTIDNEGNISGLWPFHTPAPDTKTYIIEVAVTFSEALLLGPSNWNFSIADTYVETTLDVVVPTFFVEDDRSEWTSHLNSVISNDELYRASDRNFGIQTTPKLALISTLQDDTLANFAASIQGEAIGFSVLMGELKTSSTENFDVLYYKIVDGGSTIPSYPNPITGITPTTIFPNSISILRTKLSTDIGFEISEILPAWQTTYEPIIIAAYVLPGLGSKKLSEFIMPTNFTGKTFKVNRFDILRNDQTEWS